jgi:hypothetical protein
MKYKFIVGKIDKFNNFVPKILILAKFGKFFCLGDQIGKYGRPEMVRGQDFGKHCSRLILRDDC